MKKFDVIVIGLGPAGMPVSTLGALMGLNVLAIEKRKHGGECLNYGCIPSKFLVKASEAAASLTNLDKFGLASNGTLDNSGVMKMLKKRVAEVSTIVGEKDVFKNITYLNDPKGGEFVDKHTVRVGEQLFYGKKIFISTGTVPFVPAIEGLDAVNPSKVLTNVKLFEEDELPESIVIVGVGAMGLEVAQSFHRMGVKVHLLSRSDSILNTYGDAEVGELLEDMFNKEGLNIIKNTNIISVDEEDDKVVVSTNNGDFTADKILFASGRKINLDGLKLENAGIKYDEKGIKVNAFLQTSQKHIYANGDCNGLQQYTHAAMNQGMLSIMNAMNPSPFKMKYKNFVVPSTIYTFPQVAQVGLTLKEAKEKGVKFDLVVKPFVDYGRTTIDGTPEGFVKVLVTPTGKILGVTIIGESAGEMINLWTVSIQNKIRMHQLMMTQFSFPTVTMLTKMATMQWMINKMDNMGNNWMKKMMKWMI